jgi:2-(1,2-epoxy-1,2-dihydrophenyl)acetyl-CoA isomerase
MKEDAAPLLGSLEGGILRLTLNRPKRFNALDDTLIDALEATLREHAAEDDLRVLVLSGNRRAFCFGADLTALPEGDARPLTLDALLPRFQTLIVRLSRFPVPTIAALSGFATGAGLDLALACDLRIAADAAKLGVAFLGMGLVPDGGGTWRLPRLIGLGRAFELIYGDRAISAERAAAIGLVNEVVPAGALEEAALSRARAIAALPIAAVRAAKSLVLANLDRDLEGALAAEAMEQSQRFRSGEFDQALAALSRRAKTARADD